MENRDYLLLDVTINSKTDWNNLIKRLEKQGIQLDSLILLTKKFLEKKSKKKRPSFLKKIHFRFLSIIKKLI